MFFLPHHFLLLSRQNLTISSQFQYALHDHGNNDSTWNYPGEWSKCCPQSNKDSRTYGHVNLLLTKSSGKLIMHSEHKQLQKLAETSLG